MLRIRYRSLAEVEQLTITLTQHTAHEIVQHELDEHRLGNAMYAHIVQCGHRCVASSAKNERVFAEKVAGPQVTQRRRAPMDHQMTTFHNVAAVRRRALFDNSRAPRMRLTGERSQQRLPLSRLQARHHVRTEKALQPKVCIGPFTCFAS